jgi:lipopolysaccharide/colanic/teichoic acid biosynthesis glycosyltransferase
MNNSESSAVASSADAFTASQHYVYTPSWDNSPDEPLQNGPSFHNGRNSDGTVAVEYSEAATAHNVQGPQKVEVPARLDAWQPDLGLWLLYGSATRSHQWKYLHGTSQGAVKARDYSSNRLAALIKRSCDVIGSLFLLIMLFPLFILVAVLIKFDSSGPVFFRHNRVGKDGKHFVLWKFRSMRTDVPKYEVSPRSVTDVRLTRIGRLIRRLSIDEMPQLINVVKGEMSLVGPRPEMPFIVARFHPAECVRLAVTPGITGLWQISPARAFPIHENLQYDLHYIHNQNFFLDCAIILRTIAAVIHGVGAV